MTRFLLFLRRLTSAQSTALSPVHHQAFHSAPRTPALFTSARAGHTFGSASLVRPAFISWSED